MMKVFVRLGLILALALATGQIGQAAVAAPADGVATAPTALPASGRDLNTLTLEEGLESEGLELTEIEATPDRLMIEAESADPKDDSAFDLVINADGSATYTLTDEIDGRAVSTKFHVVLQTVTQDRVEFDLTNPKTGETIHYDSDKPVQSIAFAIPLIWGAISLGTILTWIAIGAAIVVGTVLFFEAARAVSDIMAAYRAENSSTRRDYYPAQRQGNKTYIAGSGLTDAQARTRGRAGQDVWAISSTRARTLCNSVRSPATFVEVHGGAGSGFLYHYHPYKRIPGTHCFYGSPR